MPLYLCHIQWMAQVWTKRLCQSCGLPVSQVLMCTLSAILTEKIGHQTHYHQPSVWHKSDHLQPILPFFPPSLLYLEDVRGVLISMTNMAGEVGGIHPHAVLSESDKSDAMQRGTSVNTLVFISSSD